MKLIGVTKINRGGKITLIKDVAEILKAEKGDKIAFYLGNNKEIMIQKV